MTALRTLLCVRLMRRCEFALGIVRTAVEDVAPTPRFLLDQLAVFALRAFHPDVILLDILAVRIAAARGELTVVPVAKNHVAATLRTFFIEWNVRHLFALVEPPRGLAFGIAGARHELPKAAALQHHHPPAVLAVLFLRGLLHIGGIK